MKNNLNVRYEQRGDYFIPCVTTNEQANLHIGVWANRPRRYLKLYYTDEIRHSLRRKICWLCPIFSKR